MSIYVLCSLSVLTVICSSFIVSSQEIPTSTIAYSAEFEILDYVNTEGRLLSGDCCSGYKSTLGHGLCRGGNSSCNPYWKICLTLQENADKNGTLMMPNQRRSELYGNAGPRVSSTKQTPTSSKPSLFKNFLNRIMNSIKAIQTINEIAVESNIKEPESSASPCSIAFWSTDVVNKMTQKQSEIKLRAKIPTNIMNKRIPFEYLYFAEKINKSESLEQQKVLVFIEIWHKSNGLGNSDKLIARHVEQINTSVQFSSSSKSIWHFGGTRSKKNNTSGIEYSYRWRLLADNNELEPSVCPQGFTGPTCDLPICSKGCHSTHGYCDKPGECKCKFGWNGENCSLCAQMPGCVHGSCTKPFECRCEDGWIGMFCDKPTCKLGCHPQNGYCEHPGECRCRFGYKGENCTDCSTMPGCQNGGCVKPLDCICYQGWKGLFCSIPMCSVGCDLENGWCRRPDECRCRVGWKGVNCTECVPYPGCERGSCTITPWTCNCEYGYGGITCSEKLDWCEKNENPCVNKGVCISVEKASGSYLCQCPLGYHGKHCERIKI